MRATTDRISTSVEIVRRHAGDEPRAVAELASHNEWLPDHAEGFLHGLLAREPVAEPSNSYCAGWLAGHEARLVRG